MKTYQNMHTTQMPTLYLNVRLNKITYLNIVIAISNGRLIIKSNDLGSEYSNPFTAIKLNRE